VSQSHITVAPMYGVPSWLSQNDAFWVLLGGSKLFCPSKPYTKELYQIYTMLTNKSTYYIRKKWSEFLHEAKAVVVSFLQNI
jgi:hypothetical protein